MPSSQLSNLAAAIREHSVRMTHQAQSSHVGSNLSMAEILAVLYGKVLRIDPADPKDPARDRLILSKGHACAALYAVLAERGFFPRSWLDSFYGDGARLPGHATSSGIPGVEASTGSLGHGLPISVGLALAGTLEGASYRVYCILSDGECDEGSNWEAALFAAHHRLGNLTVIVDYNKIQSLGRVEDVLGLEPFADKWRAFGWDVEETDGHDLDTLGPALEPSPTAVGLPRCVIAHTVKGKGVSFMEHELLWHYRTPQGAEYDAALAELREAA